MAFFLAFKASASPINVAGCPRVQPPWQDAIWLAVKIYSPLDVPAPPKWMVADCHPSFGSYELPVRASSIANLFRVLGWFFIPIAIAALTGLLTRASVSQSGFVKRTS